MRNIVKLSLLALIGFGLVACGTPGNPSSATSSPTPSSSIEPSSSSSSEDSSPSSEDSSSSEDTSSSSEESSSSSEEQSSSSEPPVVYYGVTSSAEIVGGTLTFSTENLAEAASIEVEAGETVTVHVTAQEGFRLNTLFSTPVVEFTAVDATHYSFTMPEEDIEVDATFDESHSVTTEFVGFYYTPTISGLDAAAEYFQGESITFTLASASGQSPITASNCLIYLNDQVVPGAVSVDEAGVATVNLTMPDADAYITICYSSSVLSGENTQEEGIYVEVDDVSGASIFGAVPNTKYVNFSGYLSRDVNFSATGVQYRINDEETWATASIGSYGGAVSIYSSGVAYTYTITISFSTTNFSDGDIVHIRAAGEVTETHTITYVNTEHLSDATKNALINEAIPGESVSIQNVAAADGYYISSVEADNESANLSFYSTYLSFTMPSADLTITFTIGEKGSIIITETEGIASAAAYAGSDYYFSTPITSVNPGSSFMVKVEVASGYSLTSVTMTEGNGAVTTRSGYSITNGYYGTYCTFTMPSDGSDATITFELARLSSITIAANENISDSFASTSSYSSGTHTTSVTPGSTFYVFADPIDGKRVSKVIMNEVSYDPYGISSTYQYFRLTAPESGDIAISFETADNGAITIADNANIASTIIVSSPGNTTALAANSILPGQTFYVGVTAAEGYLPVSGSMNGGAASSAVSTINGVVYFAFLMPSDGSDASIVFECSAAYTVTVAQVEGGYISVSGSAFGAGSTVEFYVSANTYYSIDTVSVVTESGTSLEVTNNGGQYSFVMPEENVTISATFVKQATATVTMTHTEDYTSDLVSSISVSFSPSYQYISYSPTYSYGSYSKEVAVGETMNISLNLNYSNNVYSTYDIAICYVVNGVTTSENLNATSYYVSISHTVEEGLTEFYFTFTLKA